MLIIELEFPAGRYHATQWGRNVNEGEVEWPPSPYRLARALMDAWKRRRPEWEETRVQPLIEALSGTPSYLLPSACAAHTRSYLNSNKKDPMVKQLIFDAFVVLDRKSKVQIGFESGLDTQGIADLEELLWELNYLGRSESWVKASIVREPPSVAWNCFPEFSGQTSSKFESVEVTCLLPKEDYGHLPHRPEILEWNGKKLISTKKACSWLDAVSLTTKRLLDEGWSEPPALMKATYLRRTDALTAFPAPKIRVRAGVKCAKYALSSRVLPRVVDTASFAERVRAYLMGIHKRTLNDDPSLVSQKFSGKTPDRRPLEGHRHAFFIPLDEDRDGRIDHLLVYSSDAFDSTELKAIDSLRSVWQPNGLPDVNLVLVSLTQEKPGSWAKRWVSATPFVTRRHYRRGRGNYPVWLSGEIRRECRFHGIPEPEEIEWIPSKDSQKPIRWFEFQRSRKGQVPLPGYGCILDFSEPVFGPFVLGSACHYGLGLFEPHE